MKICTKCRWYGLAPRWSFHSARCFHPSVVEVDPVDGSIGGPYCQWRRGNKNGDCGPEGLQFEQKKSIMSRIIAAITGNRNEV